MLRNTALLGAELFGTPWMDNVCCLKFPLVMMVNFIQPTLGYLTVTSTYLITFFLHFFIRGIIKEPLDCRKARRWRRITQWRWTRRSVLPKRWPLMPLDLFISTFGTKSVNSLATSISHLLQVIHLSLFPTYFSITRLRTEHPFP